MTIMKCLPGSEANTRPSFQLSGSDGPKGFTGSLTNPLMERDRNTNTFIQVPCNTAQSPHSKDITIKKPHPLWMDAFGKQDMFAASGFCSAESLKGLLLFSYG